MTTLNFIIRRATLTAGKRCKSTLADSGQGVHKLSPETSVPVSLIHFSRFENQTPRTDQVNLHSNVDYHLENLFQEPNHTF